MAGSGALTLNNPTFPAASDPQAIILDSQHRYAYVLNNAGTGTTGGVLQFTVDRGHGTLAVVQAPNPASNITGPVSPVPTGAVPVAITIDPSDKFVFVANSESNSISVYSLESATGALAQVANSPFSTGATPVSLVARGTSLFVANQGAATISVYNFDSTSGALTLSGTPTAVGTNTTSIAADPAGKLLFVADGTANTVAVFSISGSGISATSTSVPVGTAPSNLYVDPSGKYLYVANAGSNNLSAFTINGSGGLSEFSGSPYATGTAPSFVTSTKDGNLVFVANKGSANVSAFKASNGSLSAVSGSPFSAGGFSNPDGLASVQ